MLLIKAKKEQVENLPLIVIVKKNPKKKRNKNCLYSYKMDNLIRGISDSNVFFLMMSPLFDITGVEVIGNEKISKETILSLSGISLGDNLYPK